LFESIEEVREKLAGQEYVCDRRLATVVYLAVKLDKPVLIEGPAGVGKTELAKSLAAAADRSLIRRLEEQSEEIMRGLPQLIEQMVERQKQLENKKDDSP
jgi:MoxR-like ATPase